MHASDEQNMEMHQRKKPENLWQFPTWLDFLCLPSHIAQNIEKRFRNAAANISTAHFFCYLASFERVRMISATRTVHFFSNYCHQITAHPLAVPIWYLPHFFFSNLLPTRSPLPLKRVRDNKVAKLQRCKSQVFPISKQKPSKFLPLEYSRNSNICQVDAYCPIMSWASRGWAYPAFIYLEA